MSVAVYSGPAVGGAEMGFSVPYSTCQGLCFCSWFWRETCKLPLWSRLTANEDSRVEDLPGCGLWPGPRNLCGWGSLSQSVATEPPSLLLAWPLFVCVSLQELQLPIPLAASDLELFEPVASALVRLWVSAPFLAHGDACFVWGRTRSFHVCVCACARVHLELKEAGPKHDCTTAS